MRKRTKYDVLTTGHLAQAMDRSSSWVRNWVASGELKCLIASDGSRLFMPKHVEDFKRRRAKRKAAMEKAKRAAAETLEKELRD